MIVGTGAILFCSLSLLTDIFKSESIKAASLEAAAKGEVEQKIHMDIGTNLTDMSNKEIILRGAIFFGWMLAFLGSMALIGLIPTVPIFIICFMRVEAREPWKIVLPMATFMCIFIYVLFDQLLTIPWPGSFLGDAIPWFKEHIPSM